MNEAKVVHSSLRKAAGLFSFVDRSFLRQLQTNPVQGSDLDPRVLSAYFNQCTAEAQEGLWSNKQFMARPDFSCCLSLLFAVTIARAIELKHKPSLISALAHETFQLFTKAAVGLASLDPSVFSQWHTYLKLKALIYHALVSIYQPVRPLIIQALTTKLILMKTLNAYFCAFIGVQLCWGESSDWR